MKLKLRYNNFITNMKSLYMLYIISCLYTNKTSPPFFVGEQQKEKHLLNRLMN